MYSKNGFTLIELLVVLAITTLLSSVIFSSISIARMKSRDARRISDFQQIKIALELYFDSNGLYPTVYGCGYNTNCYDYSYSASSWNDLATKLSPYIKSLPKDPLNKSCAPWAGAECFSYSYGNVGDGTISGPNTNGQMGYDLTTLLETPDHPLSCGKVPGGHSLYFGRSMWCGAYSKQIYEGSPM